MSDPVSTLLAAPAIVAAITFAAKRLFVFDLELRTRRKEAQLRHLQTEDRLRRHAQQEIVYTDAEAARARLAWAEAQVDAAHAALLRAHRVPSGEEVESDIAELDARLDIARTEREHAREHFIEHQARLLDLPTADRRTPTMRPHRAVKTDIPTWILAFLPDHDAARYGQEWTAHLLQRLQDGELREARVDRRRLVRAAAVMIVTNRLARAQSARRRSGN